MGSGSIDSSPTSTSQTLTIPTTSAMAASNPYQAFLDSLQRNNRHAFLRPTASISNSSLQFVKSTLDDFAGKVSDEQHATIRELNKKRKRSDAPVAKGEVLKLRKVHIDGLETSQIWQQAQKIIASTLEYSTETIRELEEKKEIVPTDLADGSESDAEVADSELGEEDDEDEDDEDDDESISEGEYDPTEFTGIDDGEEAGEDIEDEDMEGAQEEDEEEDEEEVDGGEYTEDPFGLNDGFFDIDEFNRQTQWLEDQDAKGDPYTDQVSDEEDIDWNADPLAPSSKSKSGKGKNKHDEDDDDDDDDDEDDGPTFGNVDLFAPDGASEDGLSDNEDDVEEPEENANEIYFKDYFAPPPKKRGEGGAKPKRQPKKIDDADVDRAINDVRRDLFDDLSENSEDEAALSDVSAGDPKSRRSAHERRQAKLAEEIRKLEAAAVEKRQWTLSGEAAAADRPANSLLEEDLDFEYVGKPVPMITPAVTEGIEDMIKRRILAREFDEVIRRRPETASADTRRGLVEIDDSKSKKGLAEIYEEEHIKNANPDSYVSKADEKLQREEAEVEAMWKSVCAKLDALSSWHYKPKPAEASLTVVADVATVAMEDAMPTTAQGVTRDSAMAPQEVYTAATAAAAAGEVVTKGGMPLAKKELSRDDKQRMRRREKERAGKRDTGDDKLSKKAKMQKDTLADLRKGGVKVVNRKGEVVDVDGNKIKEGKTMSSGNYKL